MMGRKGQTGDHPALRYNSAAHCPACGSGWIRESSKGEARCGVCGKRLIQKRGKQSRSRRERRKSACASRGVVPCHVPPPGLSSRELYAEVLRWASKTAPAHTSLTDRVICTAS